MLALWYGSGEEAQAGAAAEGNRTEPTPCGSAQRIEGPSESWAATSLVDAPDGNPSEVDKGYALVTINQ